MRVLLRKMKPNEKSQRGRDADLGKRRGQTRHPLQCPR
jgi:hypothetical protein